jgi:2-methylcitrate dehydratase PrpD
VTGDASTFFEQIAAWVDGITFDAIPGDATRNAERAVLDLLGVSIAGTTHELTTLLGRYLGASGLTADASCGLIGRSERASAEGATLYNAAIGHVLDFDDSSDTLGGHPTVVMLPALLAISETRTVTGAELLTAYVAGVEVAAHIANQVNIAHYERGWHPTATLGIFGCAAASAKLLGLDATGISRALSIASASPSGLRAHFGTHMKSVQVGEAARSGLRSALLAAADIVGHPAAFEHEQGFGAVYNGEDGFRSAPFDASPTRRWDIIEPGLVVKQYPCCASAHPAVDAVLDLRDEVGDIDGIAEIRIRLHPRRLRHTDNPHPRTPLQGKFSVQYLVATALSTGAVTLHDFTAQAMGRRQVGQLLDRTKAEAFPPEEYGPDHYAGEVTLHLADGSTLRRRVEKARGRGTEFALSDREIIGKFRSCAAPVLGDAKVDAMLDAVNSLSTMSDVRELVTLTTGAPT